MMKEEEEAMEMVATQYQVQVLQEEILIMNHKQDKAILILTEEMVVVSKHSRDKEQDLVE